MEDKTRYEPVFTGSNANLTLRSFSNFYRICMESGLVIWMYYAVYAQNQILKRHGLVIHASTENRFNDTGNAYNTSILRNCAINWIWIDDVILL